MLMTSSSTRCKILSRCLYSYTIVPRGIRSSGTILLLLPRYLSSSQHNQAKAKANAKGRVKASSRFQNSKTVQPIIDETPEYVKPPQVIRQEIREQYGDKIPEKYIDDIIAESQQFNEQVKQSINVEDGSFIAKKFEADDIESFKNYVEGIIENFQKDINSNGMKQVEAEQEEEEESTFMSKITSMLSSSKVAQNIDNITDKIVQKFKPSAQDELINLLKAISQNIKKHNKDLPLELQTELFNCAIRLPPGDDQDFCLFVAGSLIYMNHGLRADPFNEARFINALLKKGNYVQAEYLWSSRRGKDVKGQRFWDEIGILIYVTAKNLHKAESLARQILAEYGCIAPVSVIELIKAHLNTVGRGKKLAMSWVQVFDNLGNEHGFDTVYKQRQQEVEIEDTEEDISGFDRLNQMDTISFEDVYSLIEQFLWIGDYDISANLVLKYLKLVPELEDFLLYKFSNLPESIQAGLYYHMGPKSNTLTSKLQQVLKISTKSDLELKQMIFKRLLQRKSPLLDTQDEDVELTSEDCYSIIRDFTTRGLHEEVNELLTHMQEVKLAKDRGDSVTKYVLPPVRSSHYIPILQKLGRHKSKEVVERVYRLLQIMNKVGVQRGQYFHTQVLLTLYRKREFHACFEYITSNFYDREKRKVITSPVLLDTIWIIYRDSNRSTTTNQVSVSQFSQLVKYTLSCYSTKAPPRLSGVSIIMETLIATQNFPLVLCYLSSINQYGIKLDHSTYLQMHKLLLDMSQKKNVLLEIHDEAQLHVFDKLVSMLELNKVKLLSKDNKMKNLYQNYDLEIAYYLIYHFYKASMNLNSEELEQKISDCAGELGIDSFTGSEPILQMATTTNTSGDGQLNG